MKTMESFVQRRMFDRVAVNVEARFFHGNIFYSGIVMNLSDNGMFIKTRKCLAPESMFAVIIRTDKKILNVLARVKRVTEINHKHCGMGIEIINPPHDLIESVDGHMPPE